MENLVWLLDNFIYGDISAENDEDLRKALAARLELSVAGREYATLEARHNALRAAAVHVYNSGYLAGHHDTVEGGYVDIHSNDMDTHHKEDVAELLTFLLEEK